MLNLSIIKNLRVLRIKDGYNIIFYKKKYNILICCCFFLFLNLIIRINLYLNIKDI